MKGELAVMGKSGDTKIQWDSETQAEVAAAKRTFDELVGKGYHAFEIDEKKKGKAVKVFDPNVERLILVPPIAGGAGV